MKRNARVVAIIQARMRSTRLPGKVLAQIQGEPMLGIVVRRVLAAQTLHRVVVATTSEAADQALADFCQQRSIDFFRGSESDVLDRYYRAALQHNADVVVRITSDCPLIDPELIDVLVRAFMEGNFDYASNSVVQTYPRGLSAEVMTLDALERAHRLAQHSYQRAHVTCYLYEHPEQFRILSVTGGKDYSRFRWTVDTPEDLALVRAIYGRLGREPSTWTEVLHLMQREPELAEMNSSVSQKALHEG